MDVEKNPLDQWWASCVDEYMTLRGAWLKKKNVDLDDVRSLGTIEDLQQFAKDPEKALQRRAGQLKSGHNFVTVLRTINSYLPAFDVFCQQQPFVVCLCWGTARILIQAATACAALRDKIIETLRKISHHIGIYKAQASCFVKHAGVKKDVKSLFTCVIDLVAQVRAHSQKCAILKALTALNNDKLENSIKQLFSTIEMLDLTLRSAHVTTTHTYQLEGISFRQEVLSQGDEIRKEVKELGTRLASPSRVTENSPPHNVKDVLALQDFLVVDRIRVESRVASVSRVGTECLRLSSEWMKWTSAGYPRAFTYTGPIACGKTFIAISLCHNFSKNISTPTLRYYFSSRLGNRHNNSISFLVEILTQIYEFQHSNHEQICFEITRYQHHYQRALEIDFHVLHNLVSTILELVGAYTLIVDGLDECSAVDEVEKQTLFEWLLKLGEAKHTTVILSFTSRTGASVFGSEADLYLTPALRHDDLITYVRALLAPYFERNLQTDQILQEELVQKILCHSQSNFIHAKLLISKLTRATSRAAIDMEVASFSSRYDADFYKKLYSSALGRLSEPEQKQLFSEVMTLMVGARCPLTALQVSHMLSIDVYNGLSDSRRRFFSPQENILELCQPFVEAIDSGHLVLCHSSAYPFFQKEMFPNQAPDLYLARKCLSILMNPRARDPQRAVGLIKQHIKPETRQDSNDSLPQEDIVYDSLYQYASLHFQEHVTAIIKPPTDLVDMTGRFVSGVAFVSWAETIFDLRRGANVTPHIQVYRTLLSWSDNLSEEDRSELGLETFYETSHLHLSIILEDDADKVLQYFPRIRLAEYFNAAPRSIQDLYKGYEQKQIILSGLSVLLEPEDPFLLNRRSSLCVEYLWLRRFPEAVKELEAVWKLQQRLFDGNRQDVYSTAWFLALAYMALNELEKAGRITAISLEKLERLFGREDRLFNSLLFCEGLRLDLLHNSLDAAARYKAAIKTLTEVAGPANGFTVAVKVVLGSNLRRQRKFDQAQELLFEGWGSRQRLFSINNPICLDNGLQYALLLRDRGDSQECITVLDSFADSSVFTDDFERYCQDVHIRVLVAFDMGEYDDPKQRSFRLIEEASGDNRDKNNRELLWLRLDVAHVMKDHGEMDEALMLFLDIVRPTNLASSDQLDLQGQPEPAEQLRIAMEALKIARHGKLQESQELLKQNNLQWVRDEDLWFSIIGGPTLDTSVIAPIPSHDSGRAVDSTA